MRTKDVLTGVVAPFWTPVDAKGALDTAGIKGMVDYLADTCAVRTIFGRSGMGKWYTFSVEETKRFADVLIPACRRRGLGVIIGAMGEYPTWRSHGRVDAQTYTQQSIELVQYVCRAGADAAVLVVPDMIEEKGVSPEETVWRYCKAVHDATDFPLVLYQPGGTQGAYRLTAEQMRRLLNLPRLVGLKLSTGEEEVFAPIAAAVRGTEFALLAGDEAFYLRAMELGACGVIGGGCMIWPEVLWAVRYYFLQGEFEKAAIAQERVRQLEALHEGKDACVLWKQVMITLGAKFQPYDRSGTPPYPREVVMEAFRAWRQLTAPYRRLCHTLCKKGGAV